MPVVRGIVRGSARERLSFFVADAGNRQERAVSDERVQERRCAAGNHGGVRGHLERMSREYPMNVHHEEASFAAHVVARDGRDVWRCLCSIRCFRRRRRSTKTAAKPAGPPGVRLRAARRDHGPVDSSTDGSGFEFSPILKPLEPFRDRLNIVSGLAHNAPPTTHGRALAQSHHLAERRPAQAHARRGCVRRHHHRSDCGAADRAGHAAALARSWPPKTTRR